MLKVLRPWTRDKHSGEYGRVDLYNQVFCVIGLNDKFKYISVLNILVHTREWYSLVIAKLDLDRELKRQGWYLLC